jgi:hypothetical protein
MSQLDDNAWRLGVRFANGEFGFFFKMLKGRDVDNCRRHKAVKEENRTHLARFRASIPGRTLQVRITRGGHKVP